MSFARRASPRESIRLGRRQRAIGICLVVGALLSGCGKGNPGKPSPYAPYLQLSTPQNVLSNLIRAYTSRDSVEYVLLYDDAYLGTSTDMTLPVVVTYSFRKVDEARHIAVLARASDVLRIEMDFGPLSSWTRFPSAGGHPEWSTIVFTNPSVALYTSGGDYRVSGVSTFEFTFAPTTPAPGSPTDTTWQIVDWTEVRD